MSKKWIVKDQYGNTIYLTNESWEHIIDPANHPEMSGYGDLPVRAARRQVILKKRFGWAKDSKGLLIRENIAISDFLTI